MMSWTSACHTAAGGQGQQEERRAAGASRSCGPRDAAACARPGAAGGARAQARARRVCQCHTQGLAVARDGCRAATARRCICTARPVVAADSQSWSRELTIVRAPLGSLPAPPPPRTPPPTAPPPPPGGGRQHAGARHSSRGTWDQRCRGRRRARRTGGRGARLLRHTSLELDLPGPDQPAHAAANGHATSTACTHASPAKGSRWGRPPPLPHVWGSGSGSGSGLLLFGQQLQLQRVAAGDWLLVPGAGAYVGAAGASGLAAQA